MKGVQERNLSCLLQKRKSWRKNLHREIMEDQELRKDKNKRSITKRTWFSSFDFLCLFFDSYFLLCLSLHFFPCLLRLSLFFSQWGRERENPRGCSAFSLSPEFLMYSLVVYSFLKQRECNLVALLQLFSFCQWLSIVFFKSREKKRFFLVIVSLTIKIHPSLMSW